MCNECYLLPDGSPTGVVSVKESNFLVFCTFCKEGIEASSKKLKTQT